MKKLILIIGLVCLFGCSNDDQVVNPAQEENNEQQNDQTEEPDLQAEQEETVGTLTGGTEKVWRMTSAILEGVNGSIDISANFNVLDDEFIFTGDINTLSVTYRPGYSINEEATSQEEALTDYYQSPRSGVLTFLEDSGNELISNELSLNITVDENEIVQGTFLFRSQSTLNFTLEEKNSSDYNQPPTTPLQFTESFTFSSNAIEAYAPGMIGSYVENSLYIVTREDALANENGNPERVIKIDANTGEVVDNLLFGGDFVSKQLHIIDDRLLVVGGRNITEYDLKLEQAPTSIEHGEVFSRHGISVVDEDIFIVGGELDIPPDENPSNRVFRWNINDQVLEVFATLPDKRSGSRATIVNDYMYIFGGSQEFLGEAENTIYKISMFNPSDVETFTMPKSVQFTYVQKYGNLIYVTGKTDVFNDQTELVGRESFLGAFNTLDDTMVELQSNLVNNTGFEAIHQMCLFNDKIFIIYGEQSDPPEGALSEWKIYSADL